MTESQQADPQPEEGEQQEPDAPTEPPATEEQIAELDNYFEKGLRSPDRD
jgi:hypothetical protein